MTSVGLQLEIFTIGTTDPDAGLLDAREAEKQREASFEQGYAAGWQDALEHMRNEDQLRRIAAEEALQAVSFTYAEAHQALQSGFLALLQAILAQILPDITRRALPVHLAAELDSLVAGQTDIPIRILCAPAAQEALAPIVAACPLPQIELIPEPGYADAQVTLCLAAQDRVIDLAAIVARLHEMVGQHIPETPVQEARHG